MTPREVIAEYLDRYPGAATARLTDPQFDTSMRIVERVLHLTDVAMESEGVDEAVRERVARLVVYGTADPADALDRVEERAAERDRLMHGAHWAPIDDLPAPAPGWRPPRNSRNGHPWRRSAIPPGERRPR